MFCRLIQPSGSACGTRRHPVNANLPSSPAHLCREQSGSLGWESGVFTVVRLSNHTVEGKEFTAESRQITERWTIFLQTGEKRRGSGRVGAALCLVPPPQPVLALCRLRVSRRQKLGNFHISHPVTLLKKLPQLNFNCGNMCR